jgi:putative transposase
MDCPHCGATTITERSELTTRGYRRFRCRSCGRGFNERTGSVFNRLHYPLDVVCLVIFWRVRYKLSFRDLAEMFLDRGVMFTHEAVRQWEAKLAPVLSEALRKQRRGRVGQSWYCDETYLKVKGRGVYLYRAIDRDGNLVDVWLSERQDQAAAEAFFRSAQTVTERIPARVTTDGHSSYPGAIKAELGEDVIHRTNRYLNNIVEIVFTQLPRPELLTPRVSGQYGADFDLAVGDQHPVNQYLYQGAFLLGRGGREARLDPVAKVGQRGRQPGSLYTTVHLRVYLVGLGRESLQLAL